jgi:hypothetical protein
MGNSGPKNQAKNVTDGVDAFKTFFTQELIQIIICETNIYAEQCTISSEIMLPLESTMRDWKAVNEGEIYVFLERKKEKGKAIPVTGCEGPQGCDVPRLPHLLDNQPRDGGKVVSLTRQSPFVPQEDFSYSFLLKAESTPGP